MACQPMEAGLGRRLREDFGITLTGAQPVGHGADPAAQLWCGTAADGSRYAVKLSCGGTPAGLVVADHLARAGVPGVAGPVLTVRGQLCSDHDGRRLSVVPWVSDARALAGGVRPEHWRSYGAVLGRLHALPVPDTFADMLPREEHCPDKVAANAHVLGGRLRAGDWPADRLAEAVARRWRTSGALVSQLVAHADRLGAVLRARAAPAVACHGDPHFGNLLLGEAGQVWLVDWDDVVLAPPERDLLFVVGGGPAFAAAGDEEQAQFLQGYGPAEVDPVRLAYYMCVRALEDVLDFAARAVDVDRYPLDERATALSIVEGVFSANGLVTLALAQAAAAETATRPTA